LPAFDFLGLCTKPFQLLEGGYISVQLPDGNWQQLFGGSTSNDGIASASRFSSARKWRGAARESGIMRRSTR
jgi:hypothetical protein